MFAAPSGDPLPGGHDEAGQRRRSVTRVDGPRRVPTVTFTQKRAPDFAAARRPAAFRAIRTVADAPAGRLNRAVAYVMANGVDAPALVRD